MQHLAKPYHPNSHAGCSVEFRRRAPHNSTVTQGCDAAGVRFHVSRLGAAGLTLSRAAKCKKNLWGDDLNSDQRDVAGKAVQRAPTLGSLLLAGVLVAAPLPGAVAAPRGDATAQTALRDAVNAQFELERSSVVTLAPPVPIGAPLSITLPIDGQPRTLQLTPRSVRAPNYMVLVQGADGELQEVEPGPVRTLWGHVVGVPGSVAAASVSEDGLTARIRLPNDAEYWIEPIASRVAGAVAGQHVVYATADAVPQGGTCLALQPPPGVAASTAETGTVAASALFITELAVDVDTLYYQQFFGTPDPVAAVEAHVNSIINTVNVQYERDVSIRHVISTLIIRTDGDPYGTNDAEGLLFQFRHEWQTVHANVPRDAAQLFTGRDLDSNTIGIAWIQGICNSNSGYSVVQPTCCSREECKTDLSAHELGHNWGAYHCSCIGWTMNPSITCANRFHEEYTIPDIVAFRNSRTCINKGDELRRLIVSSDSTTVPEDGSLQFTAIADFLFGQDRDVTLDASWSATPPEAGEMDTSALFTAFDVDGDRCSTVTAAYEFDGTVYTKDKTILVRDLDTPLAVVGGDPPDGAIDARQPSQPDGSFPVGWQTVELGFSGDICLMTSGDFRVTQLGGIGPAPGILELQPVGSRSLQVLLARSIEPGAWTTVTHIDSGETVSVGFLPADVSGDGTAGPDDIAILKAALAGSVVLPPWSTDIDRSGGTAPADLLRAVDLLVGASGYASWNSHSLP